MWIPVVFVLNTDGTNSLMFDSNIAFQTKDVCMTSLNAIQGALTANPAIARAWFSCLEVSQLLVL